MGGWWGRGVEQGKVERSVHASNPRRTGAIGGADPHTHTHTHTHIRPTGQAVPSPGATYQHEQSKN